MIKQIYQEWKERRKARIEECRNWMPEPYRITPEELEEINQLLEEMDKMEQRAGTVILPRPFARTRVGVSRGFIDSIVFVKDLGTCADQ